MWSSPRLTDREASPSAYTVFPAVLQLLLFLPVVLAGLWLVCPRPDTKIAAAGAMRFGLGYAKWVLLSLTLFDLSQMVWRSEPQCWSVAVAWSGLIAGIMACHFFVTGLADVTSGALRFLGVEPGEGSGIAQRVVRFADAGASRALLRILTATLLVFAMAAGLQGSLQYLRSLVSGAPSSAIGVFQSARVLSNFHVITMIAALFCAIRLPRTDDFLRQPLRWKGNICLSLLALSVVMLWTRGIPHL